MNKWWTVLVAGALSCVFGQEIGYESQGYGSQGFESVFPSNPQGPADESVEQNVTTTANNNNDDGDGSWGLRKGFEYSWLKAAYDPMNTALKDVYGGGFFFGLSKIFNNRKTVEAVTSLDLDFKLFGGKPNDPFPYLRVNNQNSNTTNTTSSQNQADLYTQIMNGYYNGDYSQLLNQANLGTLTGLGGDDDEDKSDFEKFKEKVNLFMMLSIKANVAARINFSIFYVEIGPQFGFNLFHYGWLNYKEVIGYNDEDWAFFNFAIVPGIGIRMGRSDFSVKLISDVTDFWRISETSMTSLQVVFTTWY